MIRFASGILLLTILVSAWCFSLHHFNPKDAPLFRANRDSDRDGLSDFQERYKYLSDPFDAHSVGAKAPDGNWNQRKQCTYTITSVMHFSVPVKIEDMTDDYQDARFLSKDENGCTVEVTYYPLNRNADGIGENCTWRKDYASMIAFLKPRPSANWDLKMRARLLAELKEFGIEPDLLTDRALVEQVSRWLLARCPSKGKFTAWYVHFPCGRPEVYPSLRRAFDAAKPDARWTDQAMFSEEVLGREMFYNRTRGECTSTAVLIATVLRALGIPTRIVVFVPAADPNDGAQLLRLLSSVHYPPVRDIVKRGLRSSSNIFADHVCNEVFVDRRWVRLNGAQLGSNILDSHCFGLLTHIYTCNDLSDLPLARIWADGVARRARGNADAASVNPYKLVSTSDHFGARCRLRQRVSVSGRSNTCSLFWE